MSAIFRFVFSEPADPFATNARDSSYEHGWGDQHWYLHAAAHREVEDRQYGVVNVQPEFDSGRSGLEAVSDR